MHAKTCTAPVPFFEAKHALGLDHEQLTRLHDGRGERATSNGGIVIDGILA